MRTTIVALAIAAGASTAMADTVQLRTIGLVSGTSGTAMVTSVMRDGAGATSRSVSAGQIHHKLGASATAKDLYTFCTEIAQTTSSSLSTFHVQKELKDAPIPGAGMGQAKADAIGRMYKWAMTEAFGGGVDVFDKLPGGLAGGTANFAVAFQLAIWEVVEDYNGTAASLSSALGNFTVEDFSTSGSTTDAGVQGFFNTLIGIAGDLTRSVETRLGALTSGSRQDQIILIPLPSSAGLAAAGLIGLAAIRRRRFH